MKALELKDLEAARKLILPYIIRTPLRRFDQALDRLPPRNASCEVYLKMENEQRTGSFKIRGAVNKMQNLSDAERARGVVASSAGNHAQGVAFAAKKLGIRATIVMPVTSPIVKINATKSYGAEVVLHGDYYDEAYDFALKLQNEKGLVFVHPFADPLIIAGQGTIAFEILEDLPDVDSIIIPVGGGGLISGIASAIKLLRPQTQIIGVVSDQATGMLDLFNGGVLTENRRPPATIAEGIAVKKPNPEMHSSYISKLVDQMVAVSDDEIAEAITFLLEKAKSVTEGSGAAGLAAFFSKSLPVGKKCCVLLCGGNIDLNVMAKVIERGLRRQSRLARISVVADDTPGNLNRLTTVLAAKRSNILEVLHDRVSPELNLRQTRIDLLIETASIEHLQEIAQALEKQGYRVSI